MPDSIPTNLQGLRLLFAQESDVELILGFIQGFFEFEKLGHEMVADAETLRR